MRIAFFGDSLTEGFPGVAFFDILKMQLPNYELMNYGKGGDTVISLYQRIKHTHLDQYNDIAFHWVGTNDVFVKISGAFPVFKTLVNQPWARKNEEFERYYRLILDILCQHANTVITVSPLFMGEDINNRWNRELEELSRIIKRVSDSYANVEYLNLRKIIFPKLKDRKPSEYLPSSLARIALDSMLLKQKEQIDKKSVERNLLFTIDGVHLNSIGAEIVADAFLETIETHLNDN